MQVCLTSGPPPFLEKRIPKQLIGARQRGKKFERKVLLALEEEGRDGLFFPQQWARFKTRENGREWRWCQFDGFHLDPRRGRCTIFEIKLQHTWKAWWQLRFLYIPLLRKMLPAELWEIRSCEIVGWYDRLVELPETVQLCEDPFDPPLNEFGVCIWKQRNKLRSV